MNDTTKKAETSEQIFDAQTIQDKRQQVIWFAQGKTRDEILELMKEPSWGSLKSKTVKFRGNLFCAHCDQMIRLKRCHECGQSEQILGTAIYDSNPKNYKAGEDRKTYLKNVASSLFRSGHLVTEINEALFTLNDVICRPKLAQREVEQIFASVGNIWLKRRKGVAA